MRRVLVLIAIALIASIAIGETAKKKSSKKTESTGKSAASTKKGSPTAGTVTGKKGTSSSKKGGKASARRKGSKGAAQAASWRTRQLSPSPQRYSEIQQALIQKGYLQQGQASGQWDQTSAEALRRFQAEQNLEPSGKIDSLSLIALGLGPKYDNAAATSPPALPAAASPAAAPPSAGEKKP